MQELVKIEASEQIKRFQDFLESFYYSQIVGNLRKDDKFVIVESFSGEYYLNNSLYVLDKNSGEIILNNNFDEYVSEISVLFTDNNVVYLYGYHNNRDGVYTIKIPDGVIINNFSIIRDLIITVWGGHFQPIKIQL